MPLKERTSPDTTPSISPDSVLTIRPENVVGMEWVSSTEEGVDNTIGGFLAQLLRPAHNRIIHPSMNGNWFHRRRMSAEKFLIVSSPPVHALGTRSEITIATNCRLSEITPA
jgi:hypothetical protein